MTSLTQLVEYTNELLNVTAFQDYCPNGLQVQGRAQVQRLGVGVTASLALLDTAIAHKVDALLVHHGYFWRGEDAAIVGMKHARIQRLIQADVSLLAYHLPLDAHEKYGNNVQLAERLGIQIKGSFANHGGTDIALHGEFDQPKPVEELLSLIEQQLQRTPLHIGAENKSIRSLGWCSGGAQNYLMQAAELGLDAYITGEASEQCAHIAKEMDIHFIAAGHHATERYGVQALGQHLAEYFNMDYRFFDIDNPI